MELLLEDAFKLLETAARLEKKDLRIEAATKYFEGCYCIRKAISYSPKDDRSIINLLEGKVEYYTRLAQNLISSDGNTVVPATVILKNTRARDGPPTDDDISVLTTPPSMVAQPTSHIQSSPINSDAESPCFTHSSELNKIASRANWMLAQAIGLDESKMTQSAVEYYMSAAEKYLFAIQLAENSSTSTSSATEILKRRLSSSLDRVEVLKTLSA